MLIFPRNCQSIFLDIWASTLETSKSYSSEVVVRLLTRKRIFEDVTGHFHRICPSRHDTLSLNHVVCCVPQKQQSSLARVQAMFRRILLPEILRLFHHGRYLSCSPPPCHRVLGLRAIPIFDDSN